MVLTLIFTEHQMNEQEKKDFLKRMGYGGSTPAPTRVPAKTETYKKPKPKVNNWVEKSDLMNLYHIFEEKKKAPQ